MNKGFTKTKTLFFVALCLLSGKSVFAQDSISIDLSQALEIALSDNPTVKVADNTIELKKYAKKETIAGLFPNISANGAYSQALKLQKVKLDFAPEPISMGQNYTMSGTFNLSLPLVAPQLWKTVQLNQQEVELAVESARSSKIEMVNQVKTAYYTLLLAQDAYKTLLAGYNNAAMNAKNVEDKFALGIVSEYDKLVADVQLRNQKPQVVNGENAVRLATMQLKVLMGVDVNEPIIFTGNLNSYESEMYSDLMSLKSDTSLTDNSSIKQLDIQKRQLVLAEKINKLGYLPTLALSLNYGWQSMNKNLAISQYQWFAGSTLALSLSIPIFDGGAKYQKTKQNKVNQINLDLQRENLVRQLELSITNSMNSIETSVEQVSSNKESMLQAEKAFTISQKRYDVGSGTLLEMNNSETALTQARLQYAQSIYDYLSAKSTLEATLGKTIESSLENNKK
ncbi:MAG: TolC family protein [Bacteroidales bacterium]|nr:TolC family protein [Bacteroidales bacterium]